MSLDLWLMLKCKRCDCERLWKNWTKRGKRRFKCSNCKRVTIEWARVKSITPSCIDCLSNHTLKKGIENGKRRYECKTCWRWFKEWSYSIHFKRSIVRRIMNWTQNKQITEKYWISNNTICRRVSRYRTEVMTYI